MKYIYILVLCCMAQICSAQDLIYKKDNTIIKVTILDIGAESISYKEYNNPNGITLNMSKSEIKKIQTASGKEIIFEQGTSMSFNKKRAFKIDPLSWTSTKLTISFEKSLKPGRSREYQIGLIGIGNKLQDVDKVGGMFFRYGIKFIRSPEKYIKEGNEAHLLKGSYFKPEIVLGGYTETKKIYDPWVYWYDPYKYEKKSVGFVCLAANVGKQWVIADDYLFDYFLGVGIGFASNNENNLYCMFGPNPVFFQTGLKLGFLY